MKTRPDTVARALTRPVNVLLAAMAIAKAERAKIDKVQRRLLAEGEYHHMDTGERITDPERGWLIQRDEFAKYNALYMGEVKRMGYDLPKDHCPALVAKRKQTEAEWALIEQAGQYFPGVDNNKLLLGTKDKGGMETRAEFIDLLIKLVVNSPAYEQPANFLEAVKGGVT